MTIINPNKQPGGEGVLLLTDRGLPVSSIHEFSRINDKDRPDIQTRIYLTDQASGVSQHGYIKNKRAFRDVSQPMKDVVMAFNVASRGYVIDLAEFCDHLKRQRKSKTVTLSGASTSEAIAPQGSMPPTAPTV